MADAHASDVFKFISLIFLRGTKRNMHFFHSQRLYRSFTTAVHKGS